MSRSSTGSGLGSGGYQGRSVPRLVVEGSARQVLLPARPAARRWTTAALCTQTAAEHRGVCTTFYRVSLHLLDVSGFHCQWRLCCREGGTPGTIIKYDQSPIHRKLWCLNFKYTKFTVFCFIFHTNKINTNQIVMYSIEPLQKIVLLSLIV